MSTETKIWDEDAVRSALDEAGFAYAAELDRIGQTAHYSDRDHLLRIAGDKLADNLLDWLWPAAVERLMEGMSPMIELEAASIAAMDARPA